MDRNTYKIAFESASEDALLTALRLLNGESCFGARLRIEALDRSGSRPNMARSPELDHHEPNYEASPEGELLAEEVALRDALRALVDCWMESGKVGGQGEFPRQRRLTARVQTGLSCNGRMPIGSCAQVRLENSRSYCARYVHALLQMKSSDVTDTGVPGTAPQGYSHSSSHRIIDFGLPSVVFVPSMSLFHVREFNTSRATLAGNAKALKQPRRQ